MITAVSVSVCLSLCDQDNSLMRLQMSTKHGRHGQRVTVWVQLSFGVDSDADADLGSIFWPTVRSRPMP